MGSNYEIASQNRLRAAGNSWGPSAARTTNPTTRQTSSQTNMSPQHLRIKYEYHISSENIRH
ncbi:hypothetical protein L484_018055 [Morus notabilis]|uniref:Uncharacterized protein n=1 Tax=Morus notabilis TaxID=981085 RepID=W9R5Q5_9ROSA|nr:hypothetical protein L484_018055 [Morus notabilis]